MAAIPAKKKPAPKTKTSSSKLAFSKYLAKTWAKRARGFAKSNRDAYPVIIFAILPALVFWGGANVTELTFTLMRRALFVSALTGLAAYALIYWLFVRDKFKASLLAILLILATFNFRYIFLPYRDFIQDTLGAKSKFQLYQAFTLLLLGLFVIIAVAVKRRLKNSPTIRNYLAMLATVLLAFNMYPIVRQWIGTRDLASIEFGQRIDIPAAQAGASERPDIYYIVPDRYANQKILKQVYGFDNSAFIDGLRDRGFYVADDSAANYPATSFSLASSLNLDYLPSKLNDRSENGLFTSLLHNAIENNRVVDALKRQDYKFVNIGPWWNTTKYSRHADQDLHNPTGVVVAGRDIDLKEHELLLFQDTLFWQFSKKPVRLFGRTIYRRTYPDGDTAGRSIHKQTVEHQFKTIKDVAGQPGPKYVFMHTLTPHDPYVFGKNCEFTPRNTEPEYENYVRQIQCANTKLLEMIDNIKANSPRPPVIILQSDEGPYPTEFRKNKELDWSKASTLLLRQKEQNLNSYYFPGRDYSQLYPSISPVNSFRVVFNKYFGTKLPLLEDRNFFSVSRSQRFKIIEVTNQFPHSKP